MYNVQHNYSTPITYYSNNSYIKICNCLNIAMQLVVNVLIIPNMSWMTLFSFQNCRFNVGCNTMYIQFSVTLLNPHCILDLLFINTIHKGSAVRNIFPDHLYSTIYLMVLDNWIAQLTSETSRFYFGWSIYINNHQLTAILQHLMLN